MRILVTGGAGYIGSHIVRALEADGHQPITLDDLSFGIPERIGSGELVSFDLASPNAKDKLVELFSDKNIEGVIHLAARKAVGESVARPEYYFQQNLDSVINLLEAVHETKVMSLVFSSSAAVYGSPDVSLVSEDYLCQPINPYGQTKLIGEWMIANAQKAWGLKAVALRYFNVSGAGFDDLGDTSVANLIPIALKAIREDKPIQVFGSDWPTKDGSCVRDYIHVADLADAHIAALDYLGTENREHLVFNVGTGQGSTVLEVIAALKDVIKTDFKVELVDRRAGDPAELAADVSRIKNTLNWQAKRNLHEIVESAYRASLN
jgi:UDP-glucose 4-epimerase